ncbi:hypothetical protein M3172_04160 [Mesobacillus subterraneus]|uniref:hypothetical protein n=1 Tax=Mesobacillus subterraneus TaxID=285983 RepID=UPI00203F73A4|nr:hypothetical protein [Mesobacillus subterraneus]MCM3572369.1 hypothetical protein [Mesobacillus subterraneus]
MVKLKIVVFILLIPVVFLGGCSADGGRVTARDVLKQNDNADILKYDGFIYSNVTNLEWFKKEKERIKKGEEIGKIKKVTTSSMFFTNFSATKLPVGTVLFDTNDGNKGTIYVETENGEALYYIQLLEG